MSLGVLGDPACPITSQGVALLSSKLRGGGGCHFLSGYILTRIKCQCKHLHPGLKSCRAPCAGGAVSQWCDRQVSFSSYPLIYKDLIGVFYVDETFPITLQARGDEGNVWLLRPGAMCRIYF